MKNLLLTLLITCAILLASFGSAQAQDCTPWGCGCPGEGDFWEGECQIMPAEPQKLPQLFLPLVSSGG